MKEERAPGLWGSTGSSLSPAWTEKGGLLRPVKGWWASMGHHQFLVGYLK